MPEPGPDDVEPVANETLRPLRHRDRHRRADPRARRGRLAGVGRRCCGWSDMVVFAIMYVAHRARRDGRLPPPVHAPRVQATKRCCAASSPCSARPRSRGRSSRGSPTTASTTPSPTSEGDPHSPHVDHGVRPGAARCAASLHAHVGWLFIHTQRGAEERYAPDLIADPVVSFVDRTFVLWAIGGLGRAVRARLADRRHADARRSPACCGAAPCGCSCCTTSTYSINSLCHFFGRRQLRHRRRVAQPRLAVALHASARRGTTTTTPSRPPPRHGLRRWEFDPSALGHPGAREGRPGVGRRAHHPRAPGRRSCCARPPERWRSHDRSPARRARPSALPDRPFRVELWDGTELPDHRRRRAHASACARRTRSPTCCARPASSASAAPTCPASSRSTTSTPRSTLLGTWKPPPLDRAHEGAARRWPPRARAASSARPRARRSSCGRAGRRHSIVRDARAVRHHYDLSNEFFALFLDESMTYSCAIFSRGADDARGGAGDQARARVHASSGSRPGERVLDVGCGWGSFAIHAAERPRRPRHRHHAVRAAGRAAPARARRGRGRRRPRRHPRHGLPRAAGERFDAIASIGMVEHVGSSQIDALRARSWRALLRARRAAAQPRHRAPAPRRAEAGPVLRALRVPRRGAAAPLARDQLRSSAPASPPITSRASASRLREHAAPLGEAPRRQPRRGRPARRRPSGCASGGSTCAPRGSGFETRLHLGLPGARGAARDHAVARAGAEQRGATRTAERRAAGGLTARARYEARAPSPIGQLTPVPPRPQ